MRRIYLNDILFIFARAARARAVHSVRWPHAWHELGTEPCQLNPYLGVPGSAAAPGGHRRADLPADIHRMGHRENRVPRWHAGAGGRGSCQDRVEHEAARRPGAWAVSYTHLTLPTIYSV